MYRRVLVSVDGLMHHRTDTPSSKDARMHLKESSMLINSDIEKFLVLSILSRRRDSGGKTENVQNMRKWQFLVASNRL